MMANSSGIITSPVRILQDLQPVLGTGLNGLGNIITNANINMWAKFKPVRLNKVTALDDSDFENANYGIGYVTFNTIESLINAYNNNNSSWVYLRPRGNAMNEWFRERDFDKYNHQSMNPVGGISVTPIIQKSSDDPIIASLLTTESTDDQVGWDNLNFNGKMLCLSLYNDSIEKTTLASSTTSKSVYMSSSDIPVGEYSAYLYLADTALSSFYTLPNHPSPAPLVVVTNETFSVSLKAVYNNVTGYVDYTIRIINSTSISQTMTACRIKLREASKGYSDALLPGEQSIPRGTIIADPGVTTLEESAIIEIDKFSTWRFWFHSEGTYPIEKSVLIALPDE